MTVWSGSARIAAVAGLIIAASARIHDLSISMDSRRAFSIEDFGFQKGGSLTLKISGFKISAGPDVAPRGAFLLHKTSSEAGTVADVETLVVGSQCVADYPKLPPTDHVIDLNKNASSFVTDGYYSWVIAEEGIYELIYMLCQGTATSFNLHAEFKNPNGNYLSAGELPLPALYIVFSLLFMLAAGLWVNHLRQHREHIHTIHHLMTLLVAVRAVTSLTQGIQLAAINSVGHPTGWSALYYIVLFVKGLLFFVAVLLVGTGWSLLKPFLSDREKRIFMIVIPLQTIANTAIIVIDEMAPGSIAASNWAVVLHLTEAACCVAVILPTVWSIRSLHTAAAADGKAKESLDRLVRFRNFFVATMGVLYFTRFGSYAMEMVVGFSMLWTVELFIETITLAYYVGIGWTFRPGADNPYVRVRADSGDDGEFGLDDGVDTAAVESNHGASNDGGRGSGDDDDEVVASSAAAEEGRSETQKAKAAKD